MCAYVKYDIQLVHGSMISTVFGEFRKYLVEEVSAEQASLSFSLQPLGLK